MSRSLPTLALVALLAALGPLDAPANERQRSSEQQENRALDRNRERTDRTPGRTRLTSIPLKIEASPRQVRIEAVIVATDLGVYAMSTSDGVERDSLDKLPLGKLPVIGGLFGSKTSSRLRPEQQVGNAYSIGNLLAITIWSAVAGSDLRLEVLPKDPVGLGERLRQTPVAPPPAAIVLPGNVGGADDVDKVIIANQNFRYEIDAASLVILNAGETVMIAGQPSGEPVPESGSPLFGDLPILGWLFQGRVY